MVNFFLLKSSAKNAIHSAIIVKFGIVREHYSDGNLGQPLENASVIHLCAVPWDFCVARRNFARTHAADDIHEARAPLVLRFVFVYLERDFLSHTYTYDTRVYTHARGGTFRI
jgi:hypothetical protein